LFKELRYDLPASIVVVFVAIPLCLGIALASGAPLFAGLIAGIVGGVVVGGASGSALGVSGPAAGLAVIVMSSIATLGGRWEAFLLAVVFAGVLQLAMGFLGLGGIAYYFPSSVIKGMLTGIGVLIILKQIPHALGTVAVPGDAGLVGTSGDGGLSEMFAALTPGAVIVTVLSLVLMIGWDAWIAPRSRLLRMIPGPLTAVALGIVYTLLSERGVLSWTLGAHQLVTIPVAASVSEFIAQFSAPDFSAITRTDVYFVALVLALIASIETLLSVEATDRLDPQKRITPTDRELKAQGLGNIVSGLVGGLPITQVIVRSSANVTFGGRTRLSTILHGFLILVLVAAIPGVLNLIPLATLAAVLFVVGYKLAKPSLFAQMYRHGWEQFLPFIATVVGIVATDLLRGIAIGMAVGVASVLRHNLSNPFTISQHEPETKEYHIRLAEEVSFLNKGRILQQLALIPDGSRVEIDGSLSKVIDFDVREIIRDFRAAAPSRDIAVEVRGTILEPSNA
jgi:SulP family sulfate permease